MSSPVVTRYAPSPTGRPHVGGARTALFNYLFAKKEGGTSILRFEDTDKARSKKEHETEIFESLEWLGLSFDKIYKQSERTLLYRSFIERMIKEGTAYISDETAIIRDGSEGEEEDEDGEKRDEVIRFKNPKKKITFTDLVLGDITVDTGELGDFVIAKSVEEPLYHLAVVIDDSEMGVTHVIRGADGIYNTPRQILIQEALGAKRPAYCHIPFVLGKDKAKLSKRNGAASATDYRDRGFLPEALINYLALLGWNPGTEQEIFTLPELVEAFDIKKIQKSAAVFDEEKLVWMNREHLRRLPEETFKKKVLEWLPKDVTKLSQWSDERFMKMLPEIKERISILSEVKDMALAGEFSYIFDEPEFEGSLLLPKTKGTEAPDKVKLGRHLSYLAEQIKALDDTTYTKEGIKEALWQYATDNGRSEVLWPMRVGLSGKEKSPDPFTLAYILGKEETCARLIRALAKLQSNGGKVL